MPVHFVETSRSFQENDRFSKKWMEKRVGCFCCLQKDPSPPPCSSSSRLFLAFRRRLRSVSDFDAFDQLSLAQKLEKHELVEMRRIAVTLPRCSIIEPQKFLFSFRVFLTEQFTLALSKFVEFLCKKEGSRLFQKFLSRKL